MQPGGVGGNTGGGGPPAMSARQLLRQQRELEEKRKFGLAPLAVDSVTQTEISPNVPQSLAQAPWFYGVAGPTLAHQRQSHTARNDVIDDKSDVVTVHAAATQYVAGACKNCGARTHKTHECTQARKKVGAVYTGRVTGRDVTVTRVDRSYAQKRDRFAGDVGVDLLRGYSDGDREASDHTATTVTTTTTATVDSDARKHAGDNDDGATAVARRRRVEDVFATRTAPHGGVEIKELPKYLQSLDAPDALFFDHRTGSMRANPNAHDHTRTFRGDLERYRSGDYYNYVETQYRFLTGQSKSFVDFAYDDEMRRAREGAPEHGQEQQHTSSSSAAAAEDDGGDATRRMHDDVVVRALHADATATRTRSSSSGSDNEGDDTAHPLQLHPDDAESTAADDTTMSAEHRQLLQLSLLPVATRNGHRLPYGSFLDAATFTWGYKCCRRVGKHAPSCAP